MKKYIFLFIILVIGVGAYAYYRSVKKPDAETVFCTQDAKQCPDGSYVGRHGPKCEFDPCPASHVNDVSDMIRVTAPIANASVKSPVTVSGEARGNWYFEASFPVKIYDANGKLLGQGPAQAEGEWMTTNFVPFKATLTFSTPGTPTGEIVFQNDNPSGLPENSRELRIPVTFSSVGQSKTIKLYYYNASKDSYSPGNPKCTEAGLVAVERTIPQTSTPLRDTIELLLLGNLTSTEKASGLSTEMPLAGVKLTNATITNGIATLTFSDPQGKTGGGSCRVNILRSQIEMTAKQFPGVTSVRLMPEELFQP